MGIYAQSTSVSAERSRSEIEHILKRYNAGQFAYATRGESAVIMFEMSGRRIRFDLPYKSMSEFRFSDRGRERNDTASIKAHEQDIRQRWRALALAIKAKLEAIESGITSFEEEFLAHIVLPNGQTYGQFAAPQIAATYESNQMPPLLGAG